MFRSRLLALALALGLSAAPAFAGTMTLMGAGKGTPGAGGGGGGSPMTTPLFMSQAYSPGIGNGAVSYLSMVGGSAVNPGTATISRVGNRMPVAGTFGNLKVNFPIPLTQGTWDITLLNASTATALTCRVDFAVANPGDRSCADITHTVHFALGDVVRLRSTPSAGPPTAQNNVQIAMTFLSDNNNESPLLSQASLLAVSTTAINYGAFGAVFAWFTTDAVASNVVAAPGTIDHLYVELQGASPTPGTYLATIYQNGAPTPAGCTVGTNCLGCLVFDATGCTDLVNSTHLNANDTLSVQVCPSASSALSTGCPTGSAPAALFLKSSLRWVPDTQGEALVFEGLANTAYVPGVAAGTGYRNFSGATNPVNGTEAQNLNIAPVAMTIKKLYERQTPNPGASAQTRIITFRANGADAPTTPNTITCTVASAATGCNDTTGGHAYSASAGDTLDWSVAIGAGGNNTALTAWKLGAVVTVP